MYISQFYVLPGIQLEKYIDLVNLGQFQENQYKYDLAVAQPAEKTVTY